MSRATGGALSLDLGARRTIHVVGMGGAGMSAISLVLAGMGHRVSGSDLRDSATLDRLRAAGVTVHVGHDPAHLPDALDAVVISTAIPDSNAEVGAARTRGIPVLRRAEALAAIVATRRTIAVAGSHGKTTTSSMLALILRQAAWRPSFVIGGDLNEVGTNAAYDEGEWLVVEADESDGTFLELAPEAILVTNVEPDHLDYYGRFDALVDAFGRFIDGARTRVVCADDVIAARLAEAAGAVTYGFAAGADYRVSEYSGDRAGARFVLERHGLRLGAIEIPVPGRHNALNAAGATALALELGAGFEHAVRALAGFGGVARRFQYRGEVRGVTLIDDYAHLPGEVAPMVHAAREGDWRRVVVVFQPHRYSRTARLWRDFADAFCGADALVLTDVYPAGEAPRAGVSGHLILRAVLDAHPDLPVTYLPQRADVVDHALDLARSGDVLLMLSAGDLTTVPDVWLAREPQP
ncbi:MAG: UDP-N-acetylmuramate--L-alanine ligase [Actinobacteria bacterium]|nr:MAG: UDP-N-acetylmuramate--L-alanine ligase [Actinomycetota bacterium]